MFVTASSAALAVADLIDEAPPWLPPVDHWELFRDGDTYEVNGNLDTQVLGAFQLLKGLHFAPLGRFEDDGKSAKGRFQWNGVQFMIYRVHQGTTWTTPETCLTCPTKLAGTKNAFVRIGDAWLGQGAAVICVPCRDRMHADWIRSGAHRPHKGPGSCSPNCGCPT